MTLSACGNGNQAASTEKKQAETTTAAATVEEKTTTAKADEATAAEATTTSAPAEETTTTTEAPKAAEYPITVEYDSEIFNVDGFVNGEAALLDVEKHTVLYISENGETRTIELPEDCYEFYNVADGIYADNFQRLFDADGNNITNKYISDENSEIYACGKGGLLIQTYDDNFNRVFGLMDFNGNWIAAPDKENVFTKWVDELRQGGSLDFPSYRTTLGNYVCAVSNGEDGLKIFDMKNNKIVATINSYPKDSFYVEKSILTDDSIIVPTQYDENTKTTTFTKVNLSTGEQTTFELEGEASYPNALKAGKNSYVIYDDNYQNKIGEITSGDLEHIDKNGYWVKEDNDFVYYTIEGEKRMIVRSK